MKLTREAIQRMISQKQGTSNVTVINQGGGGGGGVTLGPLLTSLNAEAMPSAEGYLHWSGTAWEWTTPTGGDPVDLTPYALKTWVQNNFATLNDISGLLTKAQADEYYAPISFVKPYLPLAAGSGYPLTGSLYINGSNNGIQWSGNKGMLCYKPASGWSGVTSNQWGVGSHDANGIIRSGSALERYDGTNNYTIYDSSNLDLLAYATKDQLSGYLPLTAGNSYPLTGDLCWSVQNATNNLRISNDGIQLLVSGVPCNVVLFDGSTANNTSYAKFFERPMVKTGTENGAPVYTNVALASELDGKQAKITFYDQISGNNITTSWSKLYAPIKSYGQGNVELGYLPLGGGTLTGSLNVGSSSYAFAQVVVNTSSDCKLVLNDLSYTDSSQVYHPAERYTYIQFKTDGTLEGALGLFGDATLKWRDSSNADHTIATQDWVQKNYLPTNGSGNISGDLAVTNAEVKVSNGNGGWVHQVVYTASGANESTYKFYVSQNAQNSTPVTMYEFDKDVKVKKLIADEVQADNINAGLDIIIDDASVVGKTGRLYVDRGDLYYQYDNGTPVRIA